jgi:hypothetical protein
MMKRLITAALVVFAITAFFALPAFAAEACADMPGMHDPTVPSLVAHLNHASELGHVKNSLVPALRAPLKTAADTSLPTTGRVGALQAFINQVYALAGKGIEPDCAQHLVTQAQQVIAVLQG